MENAIASKYHASKSGKVNKRFYNHKKANFVRYADYFIVTADSFQNIKYFQHLPHPLHPHPRYALAIQNPSEL